MRVVVNVLSQAGARTGVGHYIAELTAALRRRAAEVAVETFPSPAWRLAERLRRRLAAPLTEDLGAPVRATWENGWRGLALVPVHKFLQGRLRRDEARLASGAFDLYHEPNFLPLDVPVPTVTTVPDLSAVLHPQWHPKERVEAFERGFRRGVERSRHLIAISEFCRQELIRELGVAPERVTRTYMGVRRGLRPLPPATVRTALRRLGFPPSYLLYLGTLEPRKNVLTLLKAYVSLPAATREKCPLMLVGGWGWKADPIRAFLGAEGKSAGVRHVGYFPDRDLPAVYNGARALVFPTFYEGFGLPPVEMLACGGAVIASTAGAVAETAGVKAHLVEPLDLDGWRTALRRVIEDDDWLGQLRRGAVEAAESFTWDACAADTLQAYRLALGGEKATARAA
jgi:alpha-1,3-rhamnosyl/mannosyltransferase